MGAWSVWLVPVIAALLLGAAVTFYLRKLRLPREETEAGIAALAGMRWRDYMHLVLAALNRRGYERVFETDASGDEGDYLLERNGQPWLLSSKHGSAYVLGSTAIAEFANAIRLRGAAGGLLVTSGHFAPEAKPLAAAQRIELLDGPTLWPELRPLLPEDQFAVIAAPAQARAKRHVAMSWFGAVVAGVLLFTLLRQHAPDEVPPSVASSPGPAPAAAVGVPPPVAPVRSGMPAPTDPASLAKRREMAAEAISTLPDVDRAIWSTQSTLLVYLLDDLGDPKAAICPLLERFDELAASRVQLTPPPESKRPVRFFQCQVF